MEKRAETMDTSKTKKGIDDWGEGDEEGPAVFRKARISEHDSSERIETQGHAEAVAIISILEGKIAC